MKNIGDKLGALAAIVPQFAIGFCVWLIHSAFVRHWHEILEGSALPPLTVFSLDTIRAVPITAGVLIFLGFLLPILRKRIVWWTLLVALLELLMLSFLFLCISLPAMSTTFKLSP
jgi:nitrate/nitrite transporter NarK